MAAAKVGGLNATTRLAPPGSPASRLPRGGSSTCSAMSWSNPQAYNAARRLEDPMKNNNTTTILIATAALLFGGIATAAYMDSRNETTGPVDALIGPDGTATAL